jgi:hypothetical protein
MCSFSTLMSATDGCPECHPLLHLAFGGGTACGVWESKRRTSTAGEVTCRQCTATWIFAKASEAERIRDRIKRASAAFTQKRQGGEES